MQSERWKCLSTLECLQLKLMVPEVPLETRAAEGLVVLGPELLLERLQLGPQNLPEGPSFARSAKRGQQCFDCPCQELLEAPCLPQMLHKI